MKKRNLKNLQLNKSKVSNLISATGGLAPGGGGPSGPIGITDNCPPSIPYTECNVGSDFNRDCGSIIGHC
jgi:hypothetical protein